VRWTKKNGGDGGGLCVETSFFLPFSLPVGRQVGSSFGPACLSPGMQKKNKKLMWRIPLLAHSMAKTNLKIQPENAAPKCGLFLYTTNPFLVPDSKGLQQINAIHIHYY
jgi:hypothetical protein